MLHQIYPFDYNRLYEYAKSHAAAYQKADPFPHVVIDNFGNDVWMRMLEGMFPRREDLAWYKYDNQLEKKLAMPHVDKLPDVFKYMLWEMNSGGFVKFIELLTGFSGLISDCEYYGGGLHQIERGGKLDVHVDFNVHPNNGLKRRVNVLLYLNSHWKEEYGGHLELWDRDVSRPVQRILPLLNRLVVFTSNDYSYHGHPEPLDCPESVTRKSIAVYYYGCDREQSDNAHSTVYKARPGEASDAALEALRRKRARGRLADKTTKGD